MPDGKPAAETVSRTDHRAGSGGLAGNHQGVRHQRRRLLQREQRASRLRTRRRCRIFLECSRIFAISAGLTYTLGRMTGSQRHGWAVWAAMAFLFVAGVTTVYWAKRGAIRCCAGADQRATAMQSGGNMEGKEVRFGIANSALFATVTTDASCGAVNGWHDSFTPLGGLVPLVNIMLSEVIFGGVGAGHVRHADLRHPGGLHRRPDGRPHAGVPGQEDRSVRREDGDAALR